MVNMVQSENASFIVSCIKESVSVSMAETFIIIRISNFFNQSIY